MAASRGHGPEPTAPSVLADSLAWYTKHAWQARFLYHVNEVAILVVAALIPTTIALELPPSSSALLGAGVVILTGLRAIFSWHDDWLRFTEARAQLVTEQELYRFRIGTYRAADRDQQLVQHVRDIETAETQGWLRMRRASAQQQPTSFSTAATEQARPVPEHGTSQLT